jgi:hypothetical protein
MFPNPRSAAAGKSSWLPGIFPRFGRAALFAIVCGAATFLAMAVTRNAGMAIHHTVLLWPMPHLLVGAAFGSLPWRWPRVGFLSLLVASNLLVINQYVVQFERNGPGGNFTDAVNPLPASLSGSANETVYFVDWGIWEAADFLAKPKKDMRESYGLLIQALPDAGQRREIDAMIAPPRAVRGPCSSARSFPWNRRTP